jgi:hypothetical protein
MAQRFATEDDLQQMLRADARRYGCRDVEHLTVPELYRVLAACSARQEASSEAIREARREWPRIVKAAFDPNEPEHQAAKAALAFRGKFRTWQEVKAALTAPMTLSMPPATADDVAAETILADVSWSVLDAAAVLHAVRGRTDHAPQPSYRRGEERRKGGDMRHRRIDAYFANLPAKDVAGPSFETLGGEIDPILRGKEKAGAWAHACCRQYAVMKALRRESVPAALLLHHDERGAMIPVQDVVDRWSSILRGLTFRVDTAGPDAARAYTAGELDLVAVVAAQEMQATLPDRQRHIVELMRTLSDAREYGGHGMDGKWFAQTLALAALALAEGRN